MPNSKTNSNGEVEPVSEHTVESVPATQLTIETPPANRNLPKLETPIYDNLTVQQRERDIYTTGLLKQYVEAHKKKQNFAKNAKRTIFVCCIIWVFLLVLTCIGLSVFVILGTKRQVSDIISLISAIIPLTIAIIGTLNIVTKYVFPEDEEKNITEIVKQIQENDLKNKQQNLEKTTP